MYTLLEAAALEMQKRKSDRCLSNHTRKEIWVKKLYHVWYEDEVVYCRFLSYFFIWFVVWNELITTYTDAAYACYIFLLLLRSISAATLIERNNIYTHKVTRHLSYIWPNEKENLVSYSARMRVAFFFSVPIYAKAIEASRTGGGQGVGNIITTHHLSCIHQQSLI
jgi:hypothetical protein